MTLPELFEIAAPGQFTACDLGEVVSVDDPETMGRVQVRLFTFDGVSDQDAPIWARVATSSAGADRGTFFLPDVGDEVLVTFVKGDSRLPVVIGGLWNGNAQPPETLGGSGDSVDRWTFVGKAGTRIAIVEENAGDATISFSTPGGVSGELTDSDGGKIELIAAGTTITVDSSGVNIQTTDVSVNATKVSVSAPTVQVDAAMSTFSGMLKCDVLKATTVIAETYTPGAGNIW